MDVALIFLIPPQISVTTFFFFPYFNNALPQIFFSSPISAMVLPQLVFFLAHPTSSTQHAHSGRLIGQQEFQ